MPTTALHRGQHLELDITTVAFGGDGIGRHDNFVIFVPFVIAGERVEVEIVEIKRRYAIADLVRVLTPSPQRVDPRCPYYMQCAGCQYQHVQYAHQLELKHAQIRDVFQRIGKVAEPPVEPVVPSPRQYHYRNKIVVHGPGKPGFWTARGRSVISISQCCIAREAINATLARIAQQELADVHLTIRTNTGGQVWTYIESGAGRLTACASADADADAQPPTEIEEQVLGKTLRVPLGSFFQVNTEVIEKILQHTRQLVAASGCRVLVDAYCGIGLFALFLADLCQHIYGIELDAAAVRAADINAKQLGLTHCDFYRGTTDRLLPYTLRQCPLQQTCVILDPPRSGCSPVVLKTLAQQKPRLIVYVSCAPPMLARDVAQLLANGYRLQRVTPFDMFPQTAHCEAVAELVLAT